MLFLKLCCFLTAGILIHSLYNVQDLVMVMVFRLFVLLFGSSFVTLGSSAIMFALPNSSGFFSKVNCFWLFLSVIILLWLVEMFYACVVVGTFLSTFIILFGSFLASLENFPSISFSPVFI